LLRTKEDVLSALHNARLGTGIGPILAQLQAVGRTRLLPSATDPEIKAQLRDDDGSLRTYKDVLSALHYKGCGARTVRITDQMQAAGEARLLPSATDAEIKAHMRKDDGSLRTNRDVVNTLHDKGLGACKNRVLDLLQLAGSKRRLPAPTVAELEAHLRDDDGSLRTRKDVIGALHDKGLGAGDHRIGAHLRMQNARGPQ
jgi:hypothetical protein